MKTSSSDKILVVDTRMGLCTESYKTRLEMVCGVMENGGIGGSYFGSPEHVEALAKIEAHVAKVRELIAQDHREEAEAANEALGESLNA